MSFDNSAVWIWGDAACSSDTSADRLELGWVLGELASRFPIEVIDEISTIDRSGSDSFFGISKPTVIYIGSQSRLDPIAELIAKLAVLFPGVPIRLVLGEFWVGHRRTKPWAQETVAAYWYQLYDLLLPEAAVLFQTSLTPASPLESIESDRSFKHVLIVSDHAENRQMWIDLLPNHGFIVAATRDSDELPEGRFGVVIVDNLRQESQEIIEKVRRVYPDSNIVVCLAFPNWSIVQACLSSGVDMIIGKPFQLAGLVRSFSSAALARK